jgi:hypothetical protein
VTGGSARSGHASPGARGGGGRPPAWRQHARGDRPAGQRAAEYLIRQACRRLPADTADERCREWTAEVGAILGDPATRPGTLRLARAMRYAAGITRCARLPELTGHGDTHYSLARGLIRGVAIYLGVIGLFFGVNLAFRWQGPGPAIAVIACCACFDAFCLVDLYRAGKVRYLPKWGWVLACLIQSPSGGIMYLSIGRVRS